MGFVPRRGSVRCPLRVVRPHGVRAFARRLACGRRPAGRVDTAPCMRALGRVLADLSMAGYDAVWGVVEDADVGAPHHRARVFAVAFRRDSHPRLRPSGSPWAWYDAARDMWVSGGNDLFGEPDVFDGVWPKHGVMTVDGVYRLLPSRAADRGLLSTSRASDGEKGAPCQSYGGGGVPWRRSCRCRLRATRGAAPLRRTGGCSTDARGMASRSCCARRWAGTAAVEAA